jgi:dTDP-4-amino-4,6-dideoxygalactose transaminase
LQAAVLIEKLKIFPDEIKRRNSIAARYSDALGPLATTPHVRSGLVSTWAQYTIKVPPKQRDGLAASLKADGIPTAVYYPRPVHQQTAYRHFPTAGNGLPVSEGIATQVISLPMHPYLDPEVQDRIIEAVRDALSDPEF